MTAPLVLHLGRDGDVPGGMTQVVNGVLNWGFSRCRTALLRTRGGGKAGHDFLLWVRALVVLTKCKPKHYVIVGHLSQGGSFVREGSLLYYAHLRGIRTVAQLHGSRFVAYATRRRRLVQFVLRKVDAVVVLSKESQAAVEAVAPSTAVRRIPNTVARSDNASAAKTNIVMFAGRISERKGADVLLRAWSILAPEGWRLVMAGPVAPDFDLGSLNDSVDIVGSLRNDEVLRYLSAAKIAVLPSRAEAMPLFILEAMARDVAVIAARVGGIPELLGDYGGYLVDAGNVEQLAHALQTLIYSPGAAEKWAQIAKRRYESCYAPESVYEDMERCWLGLPERGINEP
jgi:glycosyltransferase involved in cell wall biosynthesis